MRGTWFFICLAWAVLPCTASDPSHILWQPPGTMAIRDWIWGAGGETRAPQGPFEFLEESLKGTNPKVKVRDSRGAHWTVKFGGEIHSEVFAARFLFAMGYEVQPNYFVRSGAITGAHSLRRAKAFIGKHGEFAYAHFKLSESRRADHVEGLEWSWTDNPFVGTQELNGLKILMMLMSNWDAKDSRDRNGSNTAVYAKSGPGGDRLAYSFDDWGATFGKWGGFFERDKWNPIGFREQTRAFARAAPNHTIEWGYHGKHGKDIASGIGTEDVRWLLTYLSRVTDDELRAGLRASGASESAIEIYTRCLRERIAQLERLSAAPASATAAAAASLR